MTVIEKQPMQEIKKLCMPLVKALMDKHKWKHVEHEDSLFETTYKKAVQVLKKEKKDITDGKIVKEVFSKHLRNAWCNLVGSYMEKAIKEDDNHVIRVFNRSIAPIIAAYVNKYDVNEAETNLEGSTREVMQETYIRVSKNMDEGNYTEQGNFKAYFVNTAVNILRERKRKDQKTSIFKKMYAKFTANKPKYDDDCFENVEEKQSFESLLRLADEKCKEIFHWIYVEGKKLKEIATDEGLKLSNVKQRHRRCKNKLKKALENLN